MLDFADLVALNKFDKRGALMHFVMWKTVPAQS
jgi:putative protein kinase ArgK-like GTPase of G3E family